MLAKSTFLHVVGADEPTSYDWVLDPDSAGAGVLVAYGGVDPTDPLAAVGGQVNPSGTRVGTPELDNPSSGSMLVAFFGIATNATFTPGDGLTERADVSQSARPLRVASAAADELLAEAGLTGTHAVTASKAAVSIGHAIVLRVAMP